MRFYNDFIGSGEENIVTPFTGGDSEEQFIRNKPTQPDDWYYLDHPITYSYNEYGHRSRNIGEIDLDNYIIFTGCSHTVGVGLELEKTFPYLVSQKLGVDYYNIAVAATGIDVLEYNLLTWMAKVKKKPKHVIIQWPDHARFASYQSDYDLIHEKSSWSGDVNDKRLIVNGEDTGMFYARKELSRRLLSQTIGVPIHSFNYGGQVAYGINSIKLRQVDKARDLSHAGIKSNINFSELIYDTIQNHK
jgi:hypothetical protein